MLDFSDANIPIKKEDILRKISEYDIFKRYCENFVDIDKPFCSSLRVDKNPGCRIYINNLNELRYKDFASGDHLDCFNYVMRKYNCTFYESLNIVSNDFNLSKIIIDIKPQLLIDRELPKITYTKQKSFINIIPQSFNIIDYNYWNQYSIDFETLELFDVCAAKHVYLFKGDKRYTFEYSKTNPIYAYRFVTNEYSYKIYWPLSPDKKKKWLFSGGVKDNTEGFDQLPLHGNILVLTKSLKDVMVLKKLGYSSISLQGEKNKLDFETFQKLKKRFNNIYSLYDNDDTGLEGAKYLYDNYNINMLFLDKSTNCKDISDYVKFNNIDKAKKLIDGILEKYT